MNVDVVKSFFSCFSRGDLAGLEATFHPQATLTAVRSGPRAGAQLHGTYSGLAGVRAFIANLGAAFETKAFVVDTVVGEGEVVFANGRFTHRLKSTGRDFVSEWALKCVVREEKIVEYLFYEDSAAYLAAAA